MKAICLLESIKSLPSSTGGVVIQEQRLTSFLPPILQPAERGATGPACARRLLRGSCAVAANFFTAMSKVQSSTKSDGHHIHRHSSDSIDSDEPPRYSDEPSGSSAATYQQQSSALDPSLSGKSVEPSGFFPTSSAPCPLAGDLEAGQSANDTQPPEFSVYQASYTADKLGNITRFEVILTFWVHMFIN
ncbi:uncharacterized protein PGTG_20978 [Puccinia graminis f. sp. tritici CRL 75-36-700-3]|uniref:Uncharacterized protein n=1 Tax=Puccinia graminis f. sp. tritici (strain CRL 75-36-700-3 / race SCCL) TaxID=418459 RepID=H6QPZ3_PUCGT|nr:uncharacterized protein PGTG_20978 [Puccinia graminis f. sp. tritici CRL 75-36-700-3]EHS64516.1 hypothetical protein PGTG_20978 [Puccinia graminis f. sp. tritici CRL 75-36-700-3]